MTPFSSPRKPIATPKSLASLVHAPPLAAHSLARAPSHGTHKHTEACHVCLAPVPLKSCGCEEEHRRTRESSRPIPADPHIVSHPLIRRSYAAPMPRTRCTHLPICVPPLAAPDHLRAPPPRRAVRTCAAAQASLCAGTRGIAGHPPPPLHTAPAATAPQHIPEWIADHSPSRMRQQMAMYQRPTTAQQPQAGAPGALRAICRDTWRPLLPLPSACRAFRLS